MMRSVTEHIGMEEDQDRVRVRGNNGCAMDPRHPPLGAGGRAGIAPKVSTKTKRICDVHGVPSCKAKCCEVWQ